MLYLVHASRIDIAVDKCGSPRISFGHAPRIPMNGKDRTGCNHLVAGLEINFPRAMTGPLFLPLRSSPIFIAFVLRFSDFSSLTRVSLRPARDILTCPRIIYVWSVPKLLFHPSRFPNKQATMRYKPTPSAVPWLVLVSRRGTEQVDGRTVDKSFRSRYTLSRPMLPNPHLGLAEECRRGIENVHRGGGVTMRKSSGMICYLICDA